MIRRWFVIGLVFVIVSGFFFVRQEDRMVVEVSGDLRLSSTCPTGFKKNAQNRCVNKNLYLQYSVPNAPGVGGLKTPLPKAREGFSPQQIDLGRYLFFDPILSANGKISCSTCHDPRKGFSDGLASSVGINDYPLKRAAPSLWNVAHSLITF